MMERGCTGPIDIKSDESKYKLLFECAKDMVFLIDLDGNILDVNSEAVTEYGYTRDELLSMNVRDIRAPAERVAVEKQLKEAFGKGSIYDTVHRRKDGSTFPVEISSRGIILNKMDLLIAIVRDVTKRREAEELVTYVASFPDMNPNPIMEIDASGNLTFSNPAASRLFPDLLSMGADHPLLKGLLPINDVPGTGEKTVITREVQAGRAFFHQTVLYLPGLKKVRIYAMDITDRKNAEQVLSESEHKWRAIFNSTLELIGLLSPDGTILEANKSALSLIGARESDVVGKPFWETPWWSHSREEQEKLRAEIRKAASGETVRFESTHIAADGSLHYIDNSIKPIKDKAGNVLFLVPEGRDITERKLIEQKLQLTQYSIDRAADEIFWVTSEGIFSYVNDAACKVLQYSRDELLTMGVWDVDTSYTREKWKKRWQELRNRGSFTFETVHRAKNGRTFPVEVSTNYVRLGNREFNFAYIKDITERKLAEGQLKEVRSNLERSLRFTEALLSAIPTPVFFKDRECRYIGCNRAFTDMMGVTSDQIKGKRVEELWPSEFAAMYHQMDLWQLDHPGIQVYEYKVKDKDGVVRPVIYVKDVFRDEHNEVAGIVGTFLDITERKRAEQALAKSNKILARAQSISHVGNWAWDLKTGRLEWSDEVFRIFGYQPQDFQPTIDWLASVVNPADRELVTKWIDEAERKTKPFNIDFRIVRQDGSVRYVNMVADKFRTDAAGNPLWLYGIIQDITDRKLAEEELRESEEKFRALAECSNAAIIVYQGEWIVSANPAAEKISGYSKGELLKLRTIDVIHTDFKELVLKRSLARQRGETEPSQYEAKIITKSGEAKWVLLSVGLMTYRGKPAGVATLLDITERKHDEDFSAALSHLKLQLLGQHRLENKLKMITDSVVSIFSADFARIWMILEGDCEEGCNQAASSQGQTSPCDWTRCLHLMASSGRYTSIEGSHRRVPIGFFKIGRIATGEEEFFITNDVVHDPQVHDHEWARSLGLVSFAGFRLLSKEGQPIGVLAFFSKKTTTPDELKYLEDLANTTSHVIQLGLSEKLLQERTVELDKSKRQAELYLDLMGHDITNMNQALRGYMELMELTPESEGIDRELVGSSLEILNRSSRMINDVKKLTQVQTGKVKWKNVDLCQILARVKSRYSNVPDRHVTINYTPGENCIVRASDLLEDVFDNLVDNAIRHSTGPVVIDLRIDQAIVEAHRYYVVTIADSGPGIPDKLKKNLLASLKEIGERPERRGFGLYLVRSLVDSFHGKIRVEDRVPGDYTKGARFVVMVPIA